MAGELNFSDFYSILTSSAFLQGLVTIPGHPVAKNLSNVTEHPIRNNSSASFRCLR